MDVSDITEKGAEDVYETFNILLRRKPKERLQSNPGTHKRPMNESCIFPDWLHKIFLSHGNPSAAQWTNMPDFLGTVEFKDAFLDADHLRFPHYQVRWQRSFTS